MGFASIGLALCASSATPGAQTISVNTKPAGFLPLPGPDLVKGLWSYEVNGRRYCLQTRGKQGLSILDMTDTGNPVEVQNVPGDYRNVRTLGNYAYATDDDGPTSIIDLSNPSKASVVATAPIGSHTLRLDESNGRA